MAKMDIAQTCDKVCVLLLHDHAASSEEIALRREAIMIVGSMYRERAGDVETALQDVVAKFTEGEFSATSEAATQ
jgi:hypothetical protein